MARRKPKSNPPLPPYEPPADDQIIVWAEDQGKPFVLAIYDEVYASSGKTNHNSYPELVERFGADIAKTAIELYRMEQAEKQD